MNMKKNASLKIVVIGLGYVGLPLAVELSKYYSVSGFDVNKKRVNVLCEGIDPNGEVSNGDLQSSAIEITSDISVIMSGDIIIVAVPTPIDNNKSPDLTPVIKASELVGMNMKRGAIVVYESTVYPGVTEDICVPILEKHSGMVWKEDFFVGYSPERINPGDKVHTFSTIVKVVAGDTKETLEKIAVMYEAAVKVGVHRAESIKIAESAKVIENTQRDINIALMNELQIIFNKLDIPMNKILKASATKWNFLKFEPGLVGGHCIGVDPYYLVYKANAVGYHPQIINAGRRINDGMGKYYAKEFIKKLIHKGNVIKDCKILICGITFKENCPDIRNTKVIDLINELKEFGIDVDVMDPIANKEDVFEEYGIQLVSEPEKKGYVGLVLAVKHMEFLRIGREGLVSFLEDDGVVYDIKGSL